MKKIGILFFALALVSAAFAQKRALTHEDFDTWKRIGGEKISNNGEVVAYHLVPGEGNQTLKVTGHDGKEILTYERGENAQFTSDSKYLIFKIVPDHEELKDLKRNKTKEKDMPKDTLGILKLSDGVLTKIARVKSFQVPEKWSGHIFYQLEEKLEVKDTTKSDSVKTEKKKKGKKVSKDNGYHLVVRNLETAGQDTIEYVTDYTVAEEANKLLFNTSGKDSTVLAGIYYHDLANASPIPLCRAKGKYKALSLDKSGLQAAFLSDLDTTKALIRNYELRYWKPGIDSAIVKADSTATFLEKGWLVSEHGRLNFSDDQGKLYFGTSPRPLVQDTSLLPEEIVNVEIWNYQNQRLHTQQNAELDEDKKKYYTAVYHVDQEKFVQLGTIEIPEIRLTDKGNPDFSLGLSYLPYQQYISWEGFPRRQDVYLINNKTGDRKLLKEDLRGSADISADGKYIYWINAEDTVWSSYSIAKDKTYNLTKAIDVPLADELNDQPNYPSAYGVAGWITDDKYLLIYDRFDIWKLHPENAETPQKITNGRNDMTRYRYYHLDREEESIDPDNMLLHLFNEKSRKEGYASAGMNGKVKVLLNEDFSFSRPIKAKDTDEVIFTKESHTKFPDLIASTLKFKNQVTLSDANPEIKDYLWSSVELHEWTSLDGIKLEGLVYKPENFDPNKKYPMITYFYERNSQNLHRHWGAVPIRSIVNPAFYASRGYVVFIVDIVYKVGYPGESCYNAVMPGVTSMIEKGFIDKDKIGIQGHSWGGYQTAYLVTKTDMFAAAESGAPVANMISAYGGIRWWTGLSRMFQYEHTQSRIGGTLWEYPLRYIENSPIFYVDKVNTPLLLMHNDADGHVPWYQGIEMFVAMRRLGKPAWMLNYNDEPHWPTKWQNIKDFNIRMQQFFDHYLMDQPMPRWMKAGIPAIEKGIEKGYELMEE